MLEIIIYMRFESLYCFSTDFYHFDFSTIDQHAAKPSVRKAKEDAKYMKLINSTLISTTAIKLRIAGRQANYVAEIFRHLTCTCPFFLKKLNEQKEGFM